MPHGDIQLARQRVPISRKWYHEYPKKWIFQITIFPGMLEGVMQKLLALLLGTTMMASAHTPALNAMQAPASRAITNDFDFLLGSWKVHNRYLKGRLQGSREWIEFEGRSEMQHLLNGLGNVDRYSFVRDGKQIEGVTLRLFNPGTGEWSIYWADTVLPGTLQPPVVGKFHGDFGEFIGDDELKGKKILCRFRWNKGAGSPQWEQAFSADGGKTWEVNWIMTFTRDRQP